MRQQSFPPPFRPSQDHKRTMLRSQHEHGCSVSGHSFSWDLIRAEGSASVCLEIPVMCPRMCERRGFGLHAMQG